MAVPFRRVSSTRRNKRRTHDKLSAPTLVVCPECGEYKMSHRVCKHCGTYKKITPKGDFFLPFLVHKKCELPYFIHIYLLNK